MLLLYCMTEDEVPSPCRGLTGVGGEEVRDVAKNGVRYFYSGWHADPSPEGLKSQALEFHKVVQRILEHTTVIPFRFPTSVPGADELTELMSQQSGGYAQELTRLHGTVQIKISVEGAGHASATATTGSEYLRQRQTADAPMNATLEKIEHAAHSIAQQTKRTRRGITTNLFLLVPREKLAELKSALKSLGELPTKATISGPWPPAEFVNCYPEPAANSSERS
jgi:hypothetical protein